MFQNNRYLFVRLYTNTDRGRYSFQIFKSPSIPEIEIYHLKPVKRCKICNKTRFYSQYRACFSVSVCFRIVYRFFWISFVREVIDVKYVNHYTPRRDILATGLFSDVRLNLSTNQIEGSNHLLGTDKKLRVFVGCKEEEKTHFETIYA